MSTPRIDATKVGATLGPVRAGSARPGAFYAGGRDKPALDTAKNTRDQVAEQKKTNALLVRIAASEEILTAFNF